MEPSIRYAQMGQYRCVDRLYEDLKEDATPEEFDNVCNKLPNYISINSFRYYALDLSLDKGNIPLIRHIVNLGGKDLLNIGDQHGVTALFYKIYKVACNDHFSDGMKVSETEHFKSLSLLCELGADINLATRYGWRIKKMGEIPRGVTVLWVAAEKTTRLDFVKILLSYGGDERACGKLSEKGQAMFSQAQREIYNDIFNENKELLKVWHDSRCAFHVFPKEIKDLVIMEKLRAGKWRQFLLKA